MRKLMKRIIIRYLSLCMSFVLFFTMQFSSPHMETLCFGGELASPSEIGYEEKTGEDGHMQDDIVTSEDSEENEDSEANEDSEDDETSEDNEDSKDNEDREAADAGDSTAQESIPEWNESTEEETVLPEIPRLLAAAAGVVTGSIFTCNAGSSADNVNKVFTFTLTATSSARQTGAPRWYILFNNYSLTNANVTSPVGKFYTQSIVKNNSTTKTVSNPTANYDGTGQKKFADSISYLCTYADYSVSMTITITNPISAITGIALVSQATNWRFESPKTGFDVSQGIAQTLAESTKNYNLTINARVPIGQILEEYGEPTLLFRIENTSTGKVSWMAITLTTGSAQSGDCYTESETYSLVQGSYTVTPMDVIRYDSDILSADVSLTSDATVTVTHSISGYGKFSHAAVLVGL